MFATTRGSVRRNKLSDFADVRPSGIIAMKLDEGEGIVGVQICTENDDVLLTAAGGQCIRFAVPEVRVFAGRTSMGVRGINLEEGDKVISLSILRHVEATADERAAYLKRASAVRRGEEGEEGAADTEEAGSDAIELGEKRYVEMSEAEQFVLTVSENGMGKRSSSYQYRTTGRGGKGIVAMAITGKTGKLVASFPVEDADQIMLVTNRGQLIRTRVDGIRIAGRSTQGVIVFDTADDERVVSVERLTEEGEENGG
jgi:DNA gyrase subunit A